MKHCLMSTAQIFIVMLVCLFLASSCEKKRTQDESHNLGVFSTTKNLTRTQIIKEVYPARIFGDLHLPEQNVAERVLFLNKILKDGRYDSDQVRVIASDDLPTAIMLEEADLKNPTFHDVLKFTRGRRALRYEVSDGLIEIQKQRNESE